MANRMYVHLERRTRLPPSEGKVNYLADPARTGSRNLSLLWLIQKLRQQSFDMKFKQKGDSREKQNKSNDAGSSD